MTNTLPLIGISTGDPAGIGPEVTVKALLTESIYRECRPLVICDVRVIEHIVALLGLPLAIHQIGHPSEGRYTYGSVDVLHMGNMDMDLFRFNEVSAMGGKASYAYVEKVIALAMDRAIDATVTGPIHKEALHKAGLKYAGHTEIYGALTGTRDYTMMLAEGDFRVVHVSTHVSLRQAIERVTTERVYRVITLADEALKRMGIERPRIAVAGLNPHAGENGLFGDEEANHILPAIQQAAAAGVVVDGPHPPDTIFPRLKGGGYDVVVCMYHDQGHIPTKLLGFQYDARTNRWASLSGVNITLGLPIIRVSVDHGTAFDKGGKGEAEPGSMIQAITQAARLAATERQAHAHQENH